MPQFNVGDKLLYKSWGGSAQEWVVLELSRAYYRLINTIDASGCICNVPMRLGQTFVERDFELKQAANPNHITVSSLDYIDSTELTDEDKEIIKEHLEHA